MKPPSTSLSSSSKEQNRDDEKCWVQYGGPQRKYEAVDIGPAAVIEIIMLPKGLVMSNVTTDIADEMTISRLPFNLESLFFLKSEEISVGTKDNNTTEAKGTGINYDDFVLNDATQAILKVSGKERNDAFRSSFVSKVGGLQPQIETIVRRVLDGRVISRLSSDEVDPDSSKLSTLDSSIEEAKELAALGLNPVRGMLLYGKPGCGKTALVREIAHALKARPPKIVAAPELLDRWVGGSEKLVRELFGPAELELSVCNGDPSKSALHIVVIDEIDAVFRKRTSSSDSGESTRSSVVNQILAKMDGIHALSNVLVIGMTNRRELLDDALLRPGRLEVQVEIPKPDKEGRREILQIHFNSLRKKGRLSKPLCEAIDGKIYSEIEGNDMEFEYGKKRKAVRQAFRKLTLNLPLSASAYDLAAVTDEFSGADIAGLVRCAGSIALSRARVNGSGIQGLFLTLEDVKEALVELKR